MVLIKDQNSGFSSVLIVNFFFMVGYITLRSSLTLYLKSHDYSATEAFSLVTNTAILLAVCSFSWGFFSRFLPSHERLVTSAVSFVAIGYALVCSSHKNLLPLGLALCVVGSGLYFVNMNLLVNNKFDSSVSRQHGNHLYLMIYNLGGLVGLSGFFATTNIKSIYIFSIVSFFVAFNVIFFLKKPTIKKNTIENNYIIFFLITIGLILLAYLLILYGTITRSLSLLLFSIAIFYVIYLSRKEKQPNYISFIFMLLLCCTQYWLSTAILYSHFTLFLSEHVNNTIGNKPISPMVYFISDPIANILMGIITYKAYKRYNFAYYKLLSVGVLFVALAFACIVLPSYWCGLANKISFIWPIISIFMLGCSEFLLQSTLYSQVNNFASTLEKCAYFIGLLRFTSVFASSIAFYLMSATTSHSQAPSTNPHSDLTLYVFMMIQALFASALYFVVCHYKLKEK